MRILCAECFNQIINIKNGRAICTHCGSVYNIAEKTTHFKIRFEGGFVKEKLTYDDVVSGIKTGAVLSDEYIASMDGPWIHIYDSSFEEYFKKLSTKEKRGGIVLYKKKKKKMSVIFAVSSLLIISIAINFILVVLLYLTSNRVTELINQITRGI